MRSVSPKNEDRISQHLMFGSHFSRAKKSKPPVFNAPMLSVHTQTQTPMRFLGLNNLVWKKTKPDIKVQELRGFRRHVRNLGNLVLFFISSLDAMLPKFQRYIVEISASSFEPNQEYNRRH